MFGTLRARDIPFTGSGLQVSGKYLQNPTPDNFDSFIPWACRERCVEVDVVITSVIAATYVSPTLKKQKSSTVSKPDTHDVDTLKSVVAEKKKNLMDKSSVEAAFGDDSVNIYTVYDNAGNLLRLKFDKNKKIPKSLLQIISLVLPYHTYLTGITINKGLDNAILYELKNVLALSNINDICLDNTMIVDGNYDILLDKESNLNNLSLSRCQIDDNTVRKIALKLSYSLPASKTLSILNLSSNKITNAGAKYLADALRSNRSLLFLNLADNLITDEGAIAILDVLQEFSLLEEEVLAAKARHMASLRSKLTPKMYESPVGSMAEDKKNMKRKLPKPASANIPAALKFKTQKKDSVKKSEEDFLKDPFSRSNVIYTSEKLLYCHGNNYLAYLNLSYNSVSYITVKHLLSVLIYQNTMNRKPKGLVRLCIEGNYIPDGCAELTQINEILQDIINMHDKSMSNITKKKPHPR